MLEDHGDCWNAETKVLIQAISMARRTGRRLLHENALAALGRLARVLGLLDLGDQQLKGLSYVLVVPRACLRPAALNLLCYSLALLGGDLSLFGTEVALVSDDDNRDRLGTLRDTVSQFMLAADLNQLTRWFRIFSRITCTISKDGKDDTE